MAKKKNVYSRLRKKMPHGTRVYTDKKKEKNRILGRKKVNPDI